MAATGTRDSRRLTPRAREIIVAARRLLEGEGHDGLSMRNLAEQLGIQAPALYKHFADKRAIELILIEQGFWESGDASLAAVEGAEDPLLAVMDGHRAWAHEHPNLWRLCFAGPLDRRGLDPAADEYSAEGLRRVIGDDTTIGVAIWVFVSGFVLLELHDRYPERLKIDLEVVWSTGVEALRAQMQARRAGTA